MLVALAAGGRAARAADAGPSPEPAPATSWYGWQVMATDGAALAAILVGYAVDDANRSAYGKPYDPAVNLLYTSSVALYALGGPVVHWAHGNGRKGFQSLGLRAGLPLAGTLVGLAIGSAACGDSEGEYIPCPVGVAALGMFAGLVAAPIFDAAGLANEPVRPAKGPRLQSAAFVPSGGGGTFVLGGRF